MPRGLAKRMITIDSSAVGIQRATKGFDVSTVGTRWKFLAKSVSELVRRSKVKPAGAA
jgi:hypothetical protein